MASRAVRNTVLLGRAGTAPAAGVSGPDFAQAFLNANATTYAAIKAALLDSISGNALVDLGMYGDSLTFGAGGADVAAGNRPTSTPAQLTALLMAAGIPAQNDGFIGGGNVATPAAYATYNPQANVSGTYAVGTSTPGCGGVPFTTSTNAAYLRLLSQTKAVTGAVSNGGLIRLTVTGHNLLTGDLALVASVGGTTEANGSWTVTKIDANTLDLQGSTFTNAYTSGGTIRPKYDSATVFAGDLTTGRTVSVLADAVDLATLTKVGTTLDPKKTAFTGLTPYTDLRLLNDQAAFIALAGMRMYNAAGKRLLVMGCGRNGWGVSDWIAKVNNYDPGYGLGVYGAKIWSINIGINDLGVANPTFKTNLQTMVSILAANSTAGYLVVGNPTNGTSLAVQQAQWTATYEVAVANNLPVLNLYYYLGTWANVTANSWDSAAAGVPHLNTAGYAVTAGGHRDLLAAALSS